MEKLNRLVKSGMFVILITLLLKHTLVLQDFIARFGLGLGIALELVGLYYMRKDRLKNT